MDPLGLVLGGGGARAAYQVGVLRAIARVRPNLEVPILTGVSAGAINAIHLARHAGTFAEAVEDLAHLWLGLRMDRVFRTDLPSLALTSLRWGLRLLSGGMGPSSRSSAGPSAAEAPRSLVDVSPLRRFLCEALQVRSGSEPIPGINHRIQEGHLRAVSLSTSSYTTGRSVTWVQGASDVELWERPLRRSRMTSLTLDHVMASAALPLFFPAVPIGTEWFGDGGIRLVAPLSPAVRLGAGRVLALSTRFDRMPGEDPIPRELDPYPPPAQVAGQLMNAVFLDLLDQDTLRMERMNRVLEALPPDSQEAAGDLRPVRLQAIRPSVDLGRRAADFEVDLPRGVRFLFRGLGTRETRSPDVLSFLLFDPGYIGALMELGERDGNARMGELLELLDPGGARPPRGPGSGTPRRPHRYSGGRRGNGR
ncbi:MAG: patatin [Gemmatimonadales bacterium]|nr:MAG: patatin [Gemmatimonadales bacterium]